jgi:predicted transposase/invertase (TIGR01784 family)
LEKWLLYLNNAEGEEMEEIAMSEPMIRKALTCEHIFTKNAQERRRYELREKAIMEEQTLIHGAKAEGKAEGKIEGAREMLHTIMEMKFGDQAVALFPLVAHLNNLDALERLTRQIFSVNTAEEANELLQKSV